MIRIEEEITGDVEVAIHVYGRLEKSNVQALESVCTKHLGKNRTICLELEGLKYIDLDGKAFLDNIKSMVKLAGLPVFLKMELGVFET